MSDNTAIIISVIFLIGYIGWALTGIELFRQNIINKKLRKEIDRI